MVKKLFENNKLFRQYFEKQPFAGYLISSEYKILAINKKAAMILGFTEQELAGKSMNSVYAQESRKTAEQLFRKGRVIQGADAETLKIQTKTGEIHEVLLNQAALPDENDIIAFSVFHLDMSSCQPFNEQIRSILDHQEIEIRELHHRIKNSLTTVSSLLNLESKAIDDQDARQKLLDSRNRILSIVHLHEMLSKSENTGHLNFKVYVHQIVNMLLQVYNNSPDKIHLNIEVDDIPVTFKTAIPYGLIVNELISNALQHAFPISHHGEKKLEVSFKIQSKKQLELMVSDNGVGIPEALDYLQSESMGLKLIHMLARDQLGGDIWLNRSNGTCVSIKCPMEPMTL